MTTEQRQLPPQSARTVFFVSDGTGITAETFGHAVLTQFDLRFRQIRMPFVDTLDKAYDAARKINDAFAADGQKPIVFSTLVKPDLSNVIRGARGMHMDLIQTFVAPLEQELGVQGRPTPSGARTTLSTARNTRTASRRSTSRWRMTTASRTRTWLRPM